MNSSADGGSIANDGKVGIAYLQETKFSLYMERIQRSLEETFDSEFKKFLQENKINVDTTIFRVTLPPPSNYEASRKQLMDSELLNNYSTASGIPELSKRFAMEEYLQLPQNKIKLNEKLKRGELGLNVNGDDRDLPKLYNPDQAELGGFEGGFGGSSGGVLGGGGGFGDFGGEGGELGDTEGGDDTTLGGDSTNLNDTNAATGGKNPPPTGGKPPANNKMNNKK